MSDNIVPRYETRNMTHIEAPRFQHGEMLGYYPCEIVRKLDASDPGYLVRFEDGYEVGAFRRELRATEIGWQMINAFHRF